MPEVRPLARSSERSAVQGDFPNGVLPSEDEIAASLGVTVRDALSVLEADRLVRRLQGIGTRMNEHVLRAPSLSRLAGFHEQISEAGYEPQIASTTIRTESASRAVLERLGRLEPLDVYAIERLFLASGAPVVHVVEHVPVEETLGTLCADDVPESIFAFAERFCRSKIDHALVALAAITADESDADRLDVAQGSPLLQLLEVHYTSDARPMAISDVRLVDRLLSLSVIRKRV